MRVTDFLRWQAALVRECAGPSQFVTTDYGGMMQPRRERGGDRFVPRHSCRQHLPRHPGPLRRLVPVPSGRLSRARSSTATSWSPRPTRRPSAGASAFQFPPYDGQMREDVYTHLSNGANMVEYWHWASIAANQETYWKGVLSHDLEPNRAYAEVSRTAHELQKIGPHLVGLQDSQRRSHPVEPRLGQRHRLHALHGGARARGQPDRRARRLRLAGAADAQVALRPERRLGFRLS